MKKMLLIILIITLPLVGCISKEEGQDGNLSSISSKAPAVNIDTDKLRVTAKIITEDEKSYEIETKIENKTGYPFGPISIYLRPLIIKEEGKTQTQKNIPVLVESKIVRGSENLFIARSIVPKSIFEIEPDISRDSMLVVVNGQFLNNSGQIIHEFGIEDVLELYTTVE